MKNKTQTMSKKKSENKKKQQKQQKEITLETVVDLLLDFKKDVNARFDNLNTKIGNLRNSLGLVVEKVVGFGLPKIKIDGDEFKLWKSNVKEDYEYDLVYKYGNRYLVAELKTTLLQEHIKELKEKVKTFRENLSSEKEKVSGVFISVNVDKEVIKKLEQEGLGLVVVKSGNSDYEVKVKPKLYLQSKK